QLQLEFTVHENSVALRELKNATILSSEDWIVFKKNFQDAYPGFLGTLKTRYLTLTPAETRYLCLLKLQLTNREMAAAQGVSSQSIKVTAYRIRKKLNLDNQEVLEAMVNEIE